VKRGSGKKEAPGFLLLKYFLRFGGESMEKDVGKEVEIVVRQFGIIMTN